MKMKLKIFQTSQKCLTLMGFATNQQQNIPNRLLNSTQIVFVTVCTLSTINLTLYIFLVVNDIEDCMDAGFSLSMVVGTAITFGSFTLRNDELFNFIKHIEIELTDRKYISE